MNRNASGNILYLYTTRRASLFIMAARLIFSTTAAFTLKRSFTLRNLRWVLFAPKSLSILKSFIQLEAEANSTAHARCRGLNSAGLSVITRQSS